MRQLPDGLKSRPAGRGRRRHRRCVRCLSSRSSERHRSRRRLWENCPTAANPDQKDSNNDGAGDACEPTVSISGVQHVVGGGIAILTLARDPQGGPLSGSIEIQASDQLEPIVLPDHGFDQACSDGYWPTGVPGEGISFLYQTIGVPAIFDADGNLGCHDGVQDYEFAYGTCDAVGPSFGPILAMDAQAPLPTVCVRRVGDPGDRFDLIVTGITPDALDSTVRRSGAIVSRDTFTGHLPRHAALASLISGQTYHLFLSVTNGHTPVISASTDFVYEGEQWMAFDASPTASMAGGGVVECSSQAGGLATLDGSGSSDPDSMPGTRDDIALFEWFENYGAPAQQFLGTGERISVSLPLGAHTLTLRVTDQVGVPSTAMADMSVVDTTPPSLTVVSDAPTLWPPNHDLVQIHPAWQVHDVCDRIPEVALLSVTSSEPDDAPGMGDGNTTGDIQGADIGTPDGEVGLRAERAGFGPGRIYTLIYRAMDSSGNTTQALAVVTVPHDQGQSPEPLLMRLEPDRTPDMVRLYWPVTPGATGYDVITGYLSNIKLENEVLMLGDVRILARDTTDTSLSEDAAAELPAVGDARFYLIKSHTDRRGMGYGTESAPWPRVPTSCDGGCP